MAKIITSFSESDSYADLAPIKELKTMLKELYTLSDKNEKLIRFIVSSDIMNRNMQTPLHPDLRTVF